MKTNDQVVQEAMDMLIKHGIETAIIIAKDPDSQNFALRIKGDNTFLIGATDNSRDLMKHQWFARNFGPKPPENEGEGWKDK